MPCAPAMGELGGEEGQAQHYAILLAVWLALCTHTSEAACHHESTTEEGVLAAVHPLAQWSAVGVPAGT